MDGADGADDGSNSPSGLFERLGDPVAGDPRKSAWLPMRKVNQRRFLGVAAIILFVVGLAGQNDPSGSLGLARPLTSLLTGNS